MQLPAAGHVWRLMTPIVRRKLLSYVTDAEWSWNGKTESDAEREKRRRTQTEFVKGVHCTDRRVL